MELDAAERQREITVQKIIHTQRDRVWEAWTNPEYLAQWWGPRGFSVPVCLLDVKPGGRIRIDLQGPDGKIYPVSGSYREIIRPEWIVFTSASIDAHENTLAEVLNMVEFAGENNQTRITIKTSVNQLHSHGTVYLGGMENDWRQSLDKLQKMVGSIRS